MFKIGDRVKLKASNQYCTYHNNPSIGSEYECAGTVENLHLPNPLHLGVVWDNGWKNTYEECDLVFTYNENSIEPQVF